MMERYLLRVVPLLVLFACVAPLARAETPPPLAFQWSLDFSPGQISIDPAGNLWFLNVTTQEIHRAKRDGNPLDAGGVANDLACDASGGAYVVSCGWGKGGARRIHADGLTACDVLVPCEGRSVASNDQDEGFIALGDYELILKPVVLKVSPVCDSEVLFPLEFVPGDMALAEDGTFFIIDPATPRVLHLDITGTELASWTLPNAAPPRFVAGDHDGNVFVASDETVFKCTGYGTVLTSWGDGTVFSSISGIAVNYLGDVYVSDSGRKRIAMYGVRQPTDNPPVPLPPPSPPPPPPPPLTSHPAAVLLHIAPLASKEACSISAKLDSVVTAESASPDDAHHSIVYLIASPNPEVYQICGAQVGIAYDAGREGHPALEVLGWHLCADLEFAGDDWPGPGSGNTITWASNYSTDVNVCGYFEVIAHGPATMSVIPWPKTGLAKIANCAAEYVLEVPPDRLGWVSWGHAGFGTDTNGCNPILEPCGGGAVPVRSSTWGRLKNLYGH